MKWALILIVIAVAGGMVIGSSQSHRAYSVPEENFGSLTLRGSERIGALEIEVKKAEQLGAPKLEVIGGNEYDFGVMMRNAKGKHVFTIKNVGTGKLVVEVAGSTCKCTVGTLENGVLEPGESTVVDMEWEAKTNSRTFGQSATLKTNDPSQHEVSLIVKGEVVEMVAAEPVSWNLGDIATTSPIELRTTLYSYSEDPISMGMPRWFDEEIGRLSKIKVEPRAVDPKIDGSHSEAKQAFDVFVTVSPGLVQGLLNHALRIDYDTADPYDHPPLEVVLTGRIVGAISVMGSSKLKETEKGVNVLLLGQAKKGDVIEEKVHILLRGPHRDETTLKVGTIDAGNALEAELGEPTTRGAMRVYPLVIRTKADAPEVEYTGRSEGEIATVMIESDRPEVAPMRLGVVFRIGDPFGS